MRHQGGKNRRGIETLTAGDWAYLSPGLRTPPEFWGIRLPQCRFKGFAAGLLFKLWVECGAEGKVGKKKSCFSSVKRYSRCSLKNVLFSQRFICICLFLLYRDGRLVDGDYIRVLNS